MRYPSIGDAPGRCRRCGRNAWDCDVCDECARIEDAEVEVARCAECREPWPDPDDVDTSADSKDSCPNCHAWAGESFTWETENPYLDAKQSDEDERRFMRELDDWDDDNPRNRGRW